MLVCYGRYKQYQQYQWLRALGRCSKCPGTHIYISLTVVYFHDRYIKFIWYICNGYFIINTSDFPTHKRKRISKFFHSNDNLFWYFIIWRMISCATNIDTLYKIIVSQIPKTTILWLIIYNILSFPNVDFHIKAKCRTSRITVGRGSKRI